ncbi:MAG: isoprenylcysteine carboxylmethyltransferase family protein [Actinomycetota bacterium]
MRSSGHASAVPTLGARGEGWVALQVAALAAVALSPLSGSRWGRRTARVRWAGAGLLGALAVAQLAAATVSLGSSLTPFPRPRPGAPLEEGSVFGLVRHPIYGGLILGSVGWSLAAGPAALVPTALLAGVLDTKARLEEVWLIERYPGYEDYRRAVTRRFIPGLW